MEREPKPTVDKTSMAIGDIAAYKETQVLSKRKREKRTRTKREMEKWRDDRMEEGARRGVVKGHTTQIGLPSVTISIPRREGWVEWPYRKR